MATVYVLWNRDERDFHKVGGRTAFFPTSNDATTFLATSGAFREDVLPKRSTNAKTWDAVSVTIP